MSTDLKVSGLADDAVREGGHDDEGGQNGQTRRVGQAAEPADAHRRVEQVVHQRDARLLAQVACVDHTVSPPSFAVQNSNKTKNTNKQTEQKRKTRPPLPFFPSDCGGAVIRAKWVAVKVQRRFRLAPPQIGETVVDSCVPFTDGRESWAVFFYPSGNADL